MSTSGLAHQSFELVVGAPRFITAPLFRRRHLRWGATDEEVRASMPGDELVTDPSFATTRAITIDARPDEVWPWIVQLGFGRGGFYSYDLLDNAGRPSADRLLEEYQSLRVGDRIPMAAKVTDTTSFTVRSFEPDAWMVWEKPHSTWAWRLTPLAGGRTRLVTRLKDRYDWGSPALAIVSLILFEFGDYPMMRKLLLGIRSRAEGLARSRDRIRAT